MWHHKWLLPRNEKLRTDVLDTAKRKKNDKKRKSQKKITDAGWQQSKIAQWEFCFLGQYNERKTIDDNKFHIGRFSGDTTLAQQQDQINVPKKQQRPNSSHFRSSWTHDTDIAAFMAKPKGEQARRRVSCQLGSTDPTALGKTSAPLEFDHFISRTCPLEIRKLHQGPHPKFKIGP